MLWGVLLVSLFSWHCLNLCYLRVAFLLLVEASLLLLVYQKISISSMHPLKNCDGKPTWHSRRRTEGQPIPCHQCRPLAKSFETWITSKKIRRQSKIRLWESMQATDFARTRLKWWQNQWKTPLKKKIPRKHRLDTEGTPPLAPHIANYCATKRVTNFKCVCVGFKKVTKIRCSFGKMIASLNSIRTGTNSGMHR